ncbi:unnamed protein product [Phytomonas sp. Hart1]|nr:unnamed protein product [Phytomonas sp. Hart1]|eukprot:CCW71578.1 unnamed protein product [Phytomonas sp. isolate Hart1]
MRNRTPGAEAIAAVPPRPIRGVEDGIGYEDACMLAIDLLSGACDVLLDRDGGLLTPHSPGEDEANRRLGLLQHAFTCSPPDGDVGSQCLRILQKSLGERVGPGAFDRHAGTHLHRAADHTGDLRRACFALLYDCIYIYSPISPTLAATLLEWTLRELIDAVRGDFLADAAAGNALLCLSEVLYVSDMEGEVDFPPRVLAGCVELRRFLFTANRPSAPGEYSLRLNMLNALALLTSFQFSFGDSPDSSVYFEESGATIGAVAAGLGDFLPTSPAASGKGFECVAVLWGLGRIIRNYLVNCGIDGGSTSSLVCSVLASTDGAGIALDGIITGCVATARFAQLIGCEPPLSTPLESLFAQWRPITIWVIQAFPEKVGSRGGSVAMLESFLLRIQGEPN